MAFFFALILKILRSNGHINPEFDHELNKVCSRIVTPYFKNKCYS